jgi:hypothetical protein
MWHKASEVSYPPTDGRRLSDFCHNLDEFYFTTAEKFFFLKLQMDCSEIRQKLIHFNNAHVGLCWGLPLH